jgi:phosphohistidine swiveling domain-containing protein
MAGETSTGTGASPDEEPVPARYVASLGVDQECIGGKARSLARLAAIGLPIPPAFAVTTELWTALRRAAPAPLPTRLATVDDVERLADARQALWEVPFPAGFEEALQTALERMSQAWRPRRPPDTAVAGPEVQYSVRSSSPTEDRPHALAAGIFDSVLRVSRPEVESAIRRVLVSALRPAAWAYLLSHPGDERETALAVLIHPFIPGDAQGAVAWQPAAGICQIAVESGVLDGAARRTIDDAARAVGGRSAAVELEWVADGPRVVFLQMRAYADGRSPAGDRRAAPDRNAVAARPASATAVGGGQVGDDPSALPWHWDSAHNPAPLSIAQSGIVEWVDRVCDIGIRQRVVDGYLFWRAAGDAFSQAPVSTAAPEEARGFSRESFDVLARTVEERVGALGEAPPLELALQLFGGAYQTLFGSISPACKRARARLRQAVAEIFGEAAGGADMRPEAWLAGVTSAASIRLSLARSIGAARDANQRRAAVAAYLDRFGDESARWDIAEPTWRERPERLVLLAEGGAGPMPHPMPSPAPPPALGERLESLAPAARERFSALVDSARAAAAVMEDDDALYATLQATIRRALLALGRQLHVGARLTSVDDVFDLPLSLLRALAAPQEARHIAPEWAAQLASSAPLDLKAIAAAGREATERARQAPPVFSSGHPGGRWRGSPSASEPRRNERTWSGLAGAAGRVVGHAVHHPCELPLPGDAILIASTLLPTELPLIFPAAIVTETGSPLGHVAAQARERGIPAVVGLAGALGTIPPGTLLLVDGERGEITRLDDEPE